VSLRSISLMMSNPAVLLIFNTDLFLDKVFQTRRMDVWPNVDLKLIFANRRFQPGQLTWRLTISVRGNVFVLICFGFPRKSGTGYQFDLLLPLGINYSACLSRYYFLES